MLTPRSGAWLAIAAFCASVPGGSLAARSAEQLSAQPAVVSAQPAFVYLRSFAGALGPDTVVIDSRPLARCLERSLAGARCLAADELLGPHRRLPSARDLLWLLGTAGLSGSESVLVVGHDPTGRDFVAAMLHVAGQRSVRILTEPIERVLADRGVTAGAGRQRSMVRETVFESPMRDELLVTRDELLALRPMPVLLDGRSDGEFWGETARSVRTGHLPGAISLPAARLRAALDTADASALPLPSGSPVAYAHDAFDGFAYLALLIAGHRVAARMYAQGWAEWAAHTTLPIDAAAYPERAAIAGAPPLAANAAGQDPASGIGRSLATGLALAALALALAAFALGWRAAGRREAK